MMLHARLACVLAFLSLPVVVQAQTDNVNDRMPGVDVKEKLGASVPLELSFTDHEGKQRKLSELFNGQKPVLLNLAYHSCPVLCSMVVHATVEGLRNTDWSVGEQFDVLTLSIDPKDTPADAAEKREEILERYGRKSAATGWHFWVGDQQSISKLTKAVGFQYRYDAEQKQYAHPAVIILLSPDAQVMRYLYGLNFPANDLRLGLLEASKGHAITTTEKIILFCYHYEPGEGYVLFATRLMQIGGFLTVLLLGGFLLLSWRRERRNKTGGTSMHLPGKTIKGTS
ncbi:MAG: SCO family protein [Myxococcales bacterium]|nr:MAG: SCO family protein [Myxococcales bacterium]